MKTSTQINKEREKEGLPRLNFRLFRKVISKLEAAPDAYDQEERPLMMRSLRVACIGGWADILSGEGDLVNASVNLDRAAASLGLNGYDWVSEVGTERAVLFDGSPEYHWPEPYCSQWPNASTRRGRARVAIRYLTHILKTGKVTE